LWLFGSSKIMLVLNEFFSSVLGLGVWLSTNDYCDYCTIFGPKD
jgi:hypothetical protein